MVRRVSTRRKTAGRRESNGHASLPLQAQSDTDIERASAVSADKPQKDHFADMTDDVDDNNMPKATTPPIQQQIEQKIEQQAEAAKPVEDNFDQQMERPGFTLTPGDGWLFFQVGRDDTFVWQGHMHVPPYGEILAVAKLDTKQGAYEITLRHGKDKNYAQICEFTMPQLKGNPYVDSEVKVPLPEPVEAAGLKVTERKYKVRAFKDERPTRKNILRIQLPEVRAGVRDQDVPM